MEKRTIYLSYKVVIDSCGELLDEWKQDPRFESVALTLSVDGVNIIDDETFDQADFLKRVASARNVRNLHALHLSAICVHSTVRQNMYMR